MMGYSSLGGGPRQKENLTTYLPYLLPHRDLGPPRPLHFYFGHVTIKPQYKIMHGVCDKYKRVNSETV
jgi:hypothetical protein